MVTQRLAEALLRMAGRRWPAERRDELNREWNAELHVLAAHRQRLRMLRFAVSLVARRPAKPLVARPPVGGRIGRTVAALLLAPLAGAGIVLVSLLATSVLLFQLLGTVDWSTTVHLPIVSTLTVVLAVVLARYAGRWARHTRLTGPLRTALGTVLPIGVLTALLVVYTDVVGDDLVPALSAAAVWLALLTLALWGAATLAGRGRVRTAWCLGVLGALVAADLAVILHVVGAVGPVDALGGTPHSDAIDLVSAPVWLFSCWTDSSFGLPRPTRGEVFGITDALELQPFLYLVYSPYVLAYAISAARSTPPSLAGVPPAGAVPPPQGSIA